jgi:hypothetical protein
MSKRKVEQMQDDESSTPAAAAPPAVGRSKRGAAAAAASSHAGAGESSAAAAAASLEDDEMVSVDKPVRRGGRVAAPTEIRPEQKEAMQRLATTVRRRARHTRRRSHLDSHGRCTSSRNSPSPLVSPRLGRAWGRLSELVCIQECRLRAQANGRNRTRQVSTRTIRTIASRQTNTQRHADKTRDVLTPGLCACVCRRQWRNYRQIMERENYHLMVPTIPTCTSTHTMSRPAAR